MIPARSQSAYGITAASVPSILGMQYPARDGTVDWRAAREAQAGQSAAAAAFAKLGYSYALAPSEALGWDCTGREDLCVPPADTPGFHVTSSDLGATILGIDVPQAASELQALMKELDGDHLTLDITGKDAPQRIAQHVKQKFGTELSIDLISPYKSELAPRKKTGKKAVAKPSALPKQQQPTKPDASARP